MTWATSVAARQPMIMPAAVLAVILIGGSH
jgi:hypothetical protein